jgi:dynein heavy chain
MMNKLLSHVKGTLTELSKGLDGSLNMSEPMEDLASALSINQVPGRNPFHTQSWENLAWWSQKSLASWFPDVIARVAKLEIWASELRLPVCLWMSGLFNPTAFNTAIMQATSRKVGLPLDRMTTETHITTWMDPEKPQDYPENGAYVYGLFMEGARWAGAGTFEGAEEERGEEYDVSGTKVAGHIVESKLKELLAPMPVMYFKAVEVQDSWEPSAVGYLRHDEGVYEAPIYTTTFRGPTYLFLATLKTNDPNSKWVMAGVALSLQDDE